MMLLTSLVPIYLYRGPGAVPVFDLRCCITQLSVAVLSPGLSQMCMYLQVEDYSSHKGRYLLLYQVSCELHAN